MNAQCPWHAGDDTQPCTCPLEVLQPGEDEAFTVIVDTVFDETYYEGAYTFLD